MDTTNLLCKSTQGPKSDPNQSPKGRIPAKSKVPGLKSARRKKQSDWVSIMNSFTADQLEEFQRAGMREEDIIAVSMIADGSTRNDIVDLVRRGYGTLHAISVAVADTACLAASVLSIRADSEGEAGNEFNAIDEADEVMAMTADRVAAMTGQSERTAKRATRLAKKFNPGQLEIFKKKGVSQDEMIAVAQFADAWRREQALILIANDTDVQTAMMHVIDFILYDAKTE